LMIFRRVGGLKETFIRPETSSPHSKAGTNPDEE
jgi:hypothetical protein